MSGVDPTTRAFFEAFETSSATGDTASLAKLFTESFLVAGPNGVQVVKASEFAHIVPKRKQMLDAAGWMRNWFH